MSKLRLYLLKGMYLLIATGLTITIWPEIIAPASRIPNESAVINSLLGALGMLCILGLKYPLKMLPLLLFELLWKLIWIFAYALPTWLTQGLDTYGQETLFACLIGVILTPIVLPWKYVIKHYFTAKTEFTYPNNKEI